MSCGNRHDSRKMSGGDFPLDILVSGTMRKALLSLLLTIVLILAAIQTSIPILEDFLIVKRQLPRAEALVVMAGSTAERLPVAAQLYKEGAAPQILLTNDGIFSAWSPEKDRNLYSIEWSEAELVQLQVPEQAIVKLTYSASGSIHDALNTRKEILARGIRSVIIVTSDYHTRRSLWTFERVLRNHPVAVGIHPAASALRKSSVPGKFLELGRELIKYAYYRVMYDDIE